CTRSRAIRVIRCGLSFFRGDSSLVPRRGSSTRRDPTGRESKGGKQGLVTAEPDRNHDSSGVSSPMPRRPSSGKSKNGRKFHKNRALRPISATFLAQKLKPGVAGE